MNFEELTDANLIDFLSAVSQTGDWFRLGRVGDLMSPEYAGVKRLREAIIGEVYVRRLQDEAADAGITL